jgi:hypothetical protein
MEPDFDRHLDRVRALCRLAIERLPRMVDPETGLFAFTTRGDPPARIGTSVRYSIIVALGLQRAARHGFSCDVDLGRLFSSLSALRPTLSNSGDLGLLLWSAARLDRPVAERALDDLLEFGELTLRRRGLDVHSTELAWVILGLCEALEQGVGREREVRARLREAFAQLLHNRGASGLFGFSRRLERGSVIGRLRSDLGFFDAQVYAILAALRVHEVLGDGAAKEAAVVVGDRLLGHQHRLGQWAWHYNVQTGALVDLYPVYSVHQDGMAPMALGALERATGLRTSGAVARGVEWLFGRNEIGEPLASPEDALLWRSLRRRPLLRPVRYPLKVASLAGAGTALDLGARLARPSMLEIDRELRPYHLGWCLYAFAEEAARAAARTGASPPAARASNAA